jgi:bifunctional non-homologous end joining protein LigD
MALKEYRAKRNFAVSPEPRGKAPVRAKKKALFFCVQKHLATQLHYDFRLEHDGVLLSWAVPKGPSVDPTVKRLAMHVEDHPLEYGEFEGIIPEGYGAGVVMLWDRGTWEPLVDDVAAALKKGDLKLRLDGVKLKGSWVLVRTAGGDGRSWLLIKHRDEWAGPLDIAAFAPRSVKSGGYFTDIIEEQAPSVWTSNRAAKSAPGGLLKTVERAIAITEEEKRGAQDKGAPKAGGGAAPPEGVRRAAATTAASKGRSTRRTPAATGRAARSPGAKGRPR